MQLISDAQFDASTATCTAFIREIEEQMGFSISLAWVCGILRADKSPTIRTLQGVPSRWLRTNSFFSGAVNGMRADPIVWQHDISYRGHLFQVTLPQAEEPDDLKGVKTIQWMGASASIITRSNDRLRGPVGKLRMTEMTIGKFINRFHESLIDFDVETFLRNMGRTTRSLSVGFKPPYLNTPAQIEAIQAKACSLVSEELEFRVVRGAEIAHYYHHDTYESDGGSLGGSCMRHSACQKYVRWYGDQENPMVSSWPEP
jgi:hypothetical protein